MDGKIQSFNELILRIFDKHFPPRDITVTTKKSPWITENLRKLMREREREIGLRKDIQEIHQLRIGSHIEG